MTSAKKQKSKKIKSPKNLNLSESQISRMCEAIGRQIEEAGCINPFDSDKGCKSTADQIKYAMREGCKFTFHPEHPMENIIPRFDPMYRNIQPREDEDESKIVGLYHDIYVKKEGLLNPPVSYVGRENEKNSLPFMPVIGNHRCRAAQMALQNGDIKHERMLTFTAPDSKTENELDRLLHDMSQFGNKTDPVKVIAPPTSEDKERMLIREWNLYTKENSKKKFTEEEKKTYLFDRWCRLYGDHYRQPKLKGQYTKALKRAFGDQNLLNSVPAPAPEDRQKLWSEYFQHESWTEVAPCDEKINKKWRKNAPMCNYHTNSHLQSIENENYRMWRQSEGKISTRWLIVRVGDNEKDKFSDPKEVKRLISKTLKFLAGENTDTYLQERGFPLYERVIFVKCHQDMDHQAYQWSKSQEEFYAVDPK